MIKRKMGNEIENEVRQTLETFGQAAGLPHDPWFFDRLQRRLKNSPSDVNVRWYDRTLKQALLAMLVAVNIFAFVWVLESSQVEENDRTTYINNLATEYGLNFTEAYFMDNGNTDTNGGGQ